MTTEALDFLAEKTLAALAKQDMAPSWLNEKRHYFTDIFPPGEISHLPR
jgi:hypothetical protein